MNISVFKMACSTGAVFTFRCFKINGKMQLTEANSFKRTSQGSEHFPFHMKVKNIPVSGTLCLKDTQRYVYWIDVHNMYLHYNEQCSCYYKHEIVCGQKQFGVALYTNTLPEATVITTKK
jgi:hypothetical protein